MKHIYLIIGFFLLNLFLFSCSNKSNENFQLKIAYNVLHNAENDDYEIFVMNLDGTEKRNISNWKGVDWVYYANEDKIYFVSDRDTTHRKYFLYEMDASGNNVRKISKFLLDDSWLGSRKNATEFVVTSKKDGKKELYLIDQNGNELSRITNNDYYENDPSFSPDGKQIVFRSIRTEYDELWIMNEDGSQARQLTEYPKDDTTSSKHNYHAGPPFWEPNSNIISFISKQEGNYSIFTIKPDGTGLKQITSGGLDEGWHTWSPDGKLIAYNGTDNEQNYDIYLMNSDGSDVKRLTFDKTYEQAPVFVKIFQGNED